MWYSATAASLRTLHVSPYFEEDEYDHIHLLAQLLMVAALRAPQLQEVSFGTYRINSSDLDSLCFLSQIKKLDIEKWEISTNISVLQMQQISGLRSLEVPPFEPSRLHPSNVPSNLNSCVLRGTRRV
jgi:hypothetical protein